MKSRGINVFKCIVNISSQDFEVYGRRKAKKMAGSMVEQHGSGEALVRELEDNVLESQSVVGWVDWCQWMLVISVKVCWWMWALWMLVGWLWWRWEVAWAGMWFLRKCTLPISASYFFSLEL